MAVARNDVRVGVTDPDERLLEIVALTPVAMKRLRWGARWNPVLTWSLFIGSPWVRVER
jgi:hypothetical protein